MLTSRIPEIVALLNPRVKVALKAGAELIAQEARARVPVDHGDLRDAIHVQAGGGGYYVVGGNSEAFYGHMVEHGTSHSAPHPFLIPAFEANRDEMVGLVAAALRGI